LWLPDVHIFCFAVAMACPMAVGCVWFHFLSLCRGGFSPLRFTPGIFPMAPHAFSASGCNRFFVAPSKTARFPTLQRNRAACLFFCSLRRPISFAICVAPPHRRPPCLRARTNSSSYSGSPWCYGVHPLLWSRISLLPLASRCDLLRVDIGGCLTPSVLAFLLALAPG